MRFVHMKTMKLAAALLLANGIAVTANAASSATATFQVLLTITKACSVTAGSTSNISIGTVTSTATNTQGTNTINVTCSKTTPYFIGLAPSNASTTGAGVMAGTISGNTDTVPYQLYSGTGTTIWGNTATSTAVGNGVAGTGTGAVQAISVYATAPGANYTPDAYKDTVTVNVNY
jgi:spore coat protein U-like protein